MYNPFKRSRYYSTRIIKTLGRTPDQARADKVFGDLGFTICTEEAPRYERTWLEQARIDLHELKEHHASSRMLIKGGKLPFIPENKWNEFVAEYEDQAAKIKDLQAKIAAAEAAEMAGNVANA